LLCTPKLELLVCARGFHSDITVLLRLVVSGTSFLVVASSENATKQEAAKNPASANDVVNPRVLITTQH
jgi:hypothetical protein